MGSHELDLAPPSAAQQGRVMSTDAPDPDGVPDDVRALLRERIGSYEQLEILLTLCEEPDGGTAEALSSRLHIPLPLTASTLTELQARGLVRLETVAAGTRYVYEPATPALEATVSRLAKAYAEHTIAIIKLMSSNAIGRVRTGAARAFADAFILRKDKRDG